PFQRNRYWLKPATRSTDTGLASAGLTTAHHPLLTAVIELPDGKGHLFTGRLSADDPAWTSEHEIYGAPVLPGTAFVDLLLHAATQVGCNRIDELTHHAFLAIPEQGALQLRLVIEPADGTGRAAFAVYTRPDDTTTAPAWTCHASGSLVTAPEADGESLTAWPPADATPVELSDFYAHFIERGYHYGPLFQGLRSAWRGADAVYAEIALPDGFEPGEYGIHPALLDAALHPGALVPRTGPDGERVVEATGHVRLPFSWSGVALHATGATRLRIRVSEPTPGTVTMAVADAAGAPVMTIGALTMREVDPSRLAEARSALSGAAPLYRVDWQEQDLAGRGPATGSWVLLGDAAVAVALRAAGLDCVRHLDLTVPEGEEIERTHALAAGALAALQDVLADEALADARVLVVLPPETDSPAVGVLVGLVRSAQAEHPDRIVLVHQDGSEASGAALPLALGTGEPEVALSEGTLTVPRLARVVTPDTTTDTPTAVTLDPNGTVLITGGTGTLGSLLAQHLVTTHGIRHL
ncbi:polyketide synthase dehydratase domain-containing protein, partial [Streptomyces sp. NRRL S-350]|uniref:polyketide synthase dehydratase domain-containing protein n=1 Tax=Streptomyces sp. NRRL S-350 TaxID=1463902 RepID=UPI0004BEDE85